MVTLAAPAKVNLFLRVLAREASGFHQIETLFVALEFGDRVTVTRAEEGVVLKEDGLPMGPPRENLAYRAAEGFLTRSGVGGGVEIHIEKRIPIRAGLGGGSSDAAATLRGLRRLLPDALAERDLVELAATLGSDVPFFLSPSPMALGWGRGHRVLPLPPLPSAPVVLAVPPVEVETPWAYARLASKRKRASAPSSPRIFPMGGFSTWDQVAALAENDFDEVVFEAHPLLGRIREALEAAGPSLSLLSGSGASLFALFDDVDRASRAKSELEGLFPDSRFVLTRTLATAF